VATVSRERASANPQPDVVGQVDSVRHIRTPALLCDLDLLEGNIARMAALTTSAGIGLRPHAKSHRSATIARLQLDAGAVGIAFAKLSEADAIIEQLRADGYPRRVSTLLTSPLAGADAAARALALAARCDLFVVVDHPDGVDELARAASTSDARLSLLCDVDVGLGRTGVVGPGAALSVVDRIAEHSTLTFAGVQGYGGHLQHIAGREQRRAATAASTRQLETVIDALESHGHAVSMRTGGGTGTANIDIDLGVLNELQTGSYVFMDREYRDALGDDPEGQYRHSLTIATTVISANHEDFVTVDAGLKAMATDAGAPLVVGHEATSTYHFFGDEQGMITNSQAHSFRRGDRVALIPPHCDPTVDRYDVLWFVRNDVVEQVVEITARGCSQ
jgi:D-serine deaminase-like pyridoxal phosphate-dependent protein